MGIRPSQYGNFNRGFNPYDPEVYENPYPIYAWLRDEDPVHHNEELNIWVLSRHADVVAGLRDHSLFSSSYGVLIEPSTWGPDAHKHLSFVAMDPPRHTHMRGLVSRGFTPRRVAALEPHIREIARGHIETALETAPEQDGLDLIRDIAAKIPMDVISELAGVPTADRERMRELGNLSAHRPPGSRDIQPESVEAIFTQLGYYMDLIAERRHAPRDDLVSALIEVTAEDEEFTDDDIAAFFTLLVGAGNETTQNLLGNAWYWAWRYPDQRAAAFGGNIDGWIEETLRYDCVAQYMARRLVEDTVMHGVAIPGGACMMLLIGSANRDPRVFPDTDSYDVSRDTSAMVSFSSGPHYCLGAALARLEARIVLEEFVARVADYDIDPDALVRAHGANTRGFRALPAMAKPR